jgi:DNA-binding XRE family transcriptional regulator
VRLSRQNVISRTGKKGLAIKMAKTINGHTFETFEDTWNDPDFLMPEEKALIELKTEIFGAFLEAREKEGLTQSQLAEKAHMTQPEIARLERPDSNPKIDTLLRATVPLGYTLKLERIGR